MQHLYEILLDALDNAPGVNCVLHRYSMMYAYFMMQFILSVILLPLCYYHVLQSFDGVKVY